MNIYRYISVLLLFCVVLPTIVEAQCPRQRLPFIGMEPSGPNSTSEIRIIVAKEYMDACNGLQAQELLAVDQANNVINIRFDEFCMDDPNCAQMSRCDTAHYIIGNLDVGEYNIVVTDGNAANDNCDPPATVDTLDQMRFSVKDIKLEGPEVYAQTGSRQCLSYTVEEFKELIDIQASMTFDSNMVRFDTVENLYPLDFLTPFSVNSPRANELRFIWLDEFVEGKDVPDGSVIFDLCFNVVGNSGDTAVLDFDMGPLSAKATDVSDISFDVLTTSGVIYIEDDKYPACTGTTDDIMCMDWLKDTVESRIREYCIGQTEELSVEVVDWRGWNLIRVTSRDISGGTPVGMSEYFSCEGEIIGTCFIGGANDGICTNTALYAEPGEAFIWRCSEELPACYTTGVDSEEIFGGILEYNLTSDHIIIKADVVGNSTITSSAGTLVMTVQNQGMIYIGDLNPGVYYIQNGQAVERFVIAR